MGTTDLAIALPILAASGWLLYRSLWRKGPCHGCSGAGCGAGGERAQPLVRLGRRPPR